MGHLVIAGTGRAGTTYLIGWLGQRGLDIGDFDPGDIDPASGGGLERPFLGDDLPYVVKDPWLYQYCDEVDPGRIDCLVVPIRDVHAAAASRVEVERRRVVESGWSRREFGWTPGGMIAPLSVEWQAAILAIGFHQLVTWAVRHDVPLLFLDFERLSDSYLESVFGGVLPT